MLLQQSPFRGEDEDEIYDAILADEPLYPIHMPRDSVSILQKLLTREPELRLGSGPTDAQEVMSHAFFRNINWDDIYHKRVPPPFLPSISSPTDTSNFDQEFTSVTPVLTPVQSGKFSATSLVGRLLILELSSPLPSYAGRIPRFLLHRRLCLIDMACHSVATAGKMSYLSSGSYSLLCQSIEAACFNSFTSLFLILGCNSASTTTGMDRAGDTIPLLD